MIVSGLSLQTLGILVGSVAALRALQLFLDFRRLLASIHYLPGYRTILAPSTVLGHLFPPTPGLTLGHDHAWLSKHTPFAEWGLDVQVGTVPKVSAEVATLTLTDVNGTMKTVTVPQGLGLTFNVPGLHYNPKYWEDPYAFKPERFLGDWNRDAFLPFSSGYRGCVGRKFSEMEGAAVLTILFSQYTVAIKDEPQFAIEMFEQHKARVLDAQSVLTLAPTRLPLVFRRRT